MRLPTGEPAERIWRAAIDAVTSEAEGLLRAIADVAGPHRRIVVTGGWSHDEAVRASKSSLGAVEASRRRARRPRRGVDGRVAAGIYASVDEFRLWAAIERDVGLTAAGVAGRGLWPLPAA